MTTWYLVICADCTPVLPQPFTDPAERDQWVIAHKDGTGHDVTLARQDDGQVTLAPGKVYVPDGHGDWRCIGETASNVTITGYGSVTFY